MPTEPTILIIDDDERLNRLLKRFLGDFGIKTLAASHPQEGLKLLRRKTPDLVVLDLMLPGMDGFAVCKAIRAESTVPIIMLTARGDLADKVIGLELGADDYLAKPFEPRELVARIHAVLRRRAPETGAPRAVLGELEVDFNLRQVTLKGAPVELTTNEFAALTLLVTAGRKGFFARRDSTGVARNRLRGLQPLGGYHHEPAAPETG